MTGDMITEEDPGQQFRSITIEKVRRIWARVVEYRRPWSSSAGILTSVIDPPLVFHIQPPYRQDPRMRYLILPIGWHATVVRRAEAVRDVGFETCGRAPDTT